MMSAREKTLTAGQVHRKGCWLRREGRPHMKAERPSLARRISLHVALIALATSIIQLAVVIWHNYVDYEHLSLAHVKREAKSLRKGLTLEPAGLSFTLPARSAHYRNSYRADYAFRVLDSSGRLIAAEQPTVLEKVSPYRASTSTAMPGLWFRKLDDSQNFYFAGGRRLRVGTEDVLIEIATFGDPAGIHWWVLINEALEDIWLPILPFALLIPATTLFVVRRALNFLGRAAQQAEAIDPGYPTQRLDLGDIPREAGAFAVAINRLLERVSQLIRAKQIFMAGAAHQLRTPLAAMLLELEKVKDERARGIEKDVANLSETVDRLLTLVRMQAIESPDFVDFNIGTVAEDAVRGLRAWAEAQDHSIQILAQEPGNLFGDPVAVREALVNLVENAVKHTPPGTAIRVIAGPGRSATVEDGGPGLLPDRSEDLFRPFRKGTGSTRGVGLGLAIVRQAVEMHGGSVYIKTSPLGGAMFCVRFD
jgi:two-component system, OmpR family, sensor histidine kinase QseC